MKLLIANRGEIARRINTTAQRLGYETIAVFADPDQDTPITREADHAVRIGPAPLAESYLSVERILTAAHEHGATAVHPGYGFLSESAEFAEAVVAAGLTWVGPRASAIAAMGSKIEARRLAEQAGVPTIPGFAERQEPEELAAAALTLGFPVLIKAAAGGGGKGIRIATDETAFPAALAEAKAEAERSFGDGRVIVERYITRPRHIEVQVIGDHHGTVIDLGTRECSVQRRYQKLLEEAPAPNLQPDVEQHLRADAVRLATAIGYDSAGTVEFVLDDDGQNYYFLEMNTRLQVEHPVTEAVTGLDLVALQLEVACGQPLPITASQVTCTGHAIEARITAEDAAAGFVPQTGTVSALEVPEGRWDSAVTAGSVLTPHYDPMIAKLIVHRPSRDEAISGLADALDQLLIGGVTTTGGFHRWLLDQPEFRHATLTTRFLDDAELPDDYGLAEAAALAASLGSTPNPSNPWTSGDRRFTSHRPARTRAMVDQLGNHYEVADTATDHPAVRALVRGSEVVINHQGQSTTFRLLSRSEQWAPNDTHSRGEASALTAPFPAVIADIVVHEGQTVSGDQPIVVIEAMKMLHTLTAGGSGTVAEIRVAVGQSVETGQTLITFGKEHDA